MPRFVIPLAVFLMGTTLTCLTFSVFAGRRLSEWEIGGVGIGVILLVIGWHWKRRRLTKRRLRNLRDSALW